MTKMTCVTCFSLAYPQPLLVCLDLRCSWNSASKHFQGHRRDASRLLNVSYPQDCPRTFLGTLLLLLGSLLQLQLQIASFQLSNSGRGLRAARREVTIGCITYQVFIRTHWPTCSAALQQFFLRFSTVTNAQIFSTLSSLISHLSNSHSQDLFWWANHQPQTKAFPTRLNQYKQGPAYHQGVQTGSNKTTPRTM